MCLDAAGRVSKRTGLGRGVNFVTLIGSSLTRQVALPNHGVGLNGQSCSCLIVGWPVGSFISNPGCWTVDRSCSCLIVGRWFDLCLERFGGVTVTNCRLRAPKDESLRTSRLLPVATEQSEHYKHEQRSIEISRHSFKDGPEHTPGRERPDRREVTTTHQYGHRRPIQTSR